MRPAVIATSISFSAGVDPVVMNDWYLPRLSGTAVAGVALPPLPTAYRMSLVVAGSQRPVGKACIVHLPSEPSRASQSASQWLSVTTFGSFACHAGRVASMLRPAASAMALAWTRNVFSKKHRPLGLLCAKVTA